MGGVEHKGVRICTEVTDRLEMQREVVGEERDIEIKTERERGREIKGERNGGRDHKGKVNRETLTE